MRFSLSDGVAKADLKSLVPAGANLDCFSGLYTIHYRKEASKVEINETCSLSLFLCLPRSYLCY